jgi:hypothetical protein
MGSVLIDKLFTSLGEHTHLKGREKARREQARCEKIENNFFLCDLCALVEYLAI